MKILLIILSVALSYNIIMQDTNAIVPKPIVYYVTVDPRFYDGDHALYFHYTPERTTPPLSSEVFIVDNHEFSFINVPRIAGIPLSFGMPFGQTSALDNNVNRYVYPEPYEAELVYTPNIRFTPGAGWSNVVNLPSQRN